MKRVERRGTMPGPGAAIAVSASHAALDGAPASGAHPHMYLHPHASFPAPHTHSSSGRNGLGATSSLRRTDTVLASPPVRLVKHEAGGAEEGSRSPEGRSSASSARATHLRVHSHSHRALAGSGDEDVDADGSTDELEHDVEGEGEGEGERDAMAVDPAAAAGGVKRGKAWKRGYARGGEVDEELELLEAVDAAEKASAGSEYVKLEA